MRRASIIGIVVAGLAVTAAETSPVCVQLSASARKFQQCFRDLDRAGTSLSPVERFVFSLVLTTSKSPRTEGEGAAPEGHRT
jgi:hypothetical protein